jgi:hypothetical protein
MQDVFFLLFVTGAGLALLYVAVRVGAIAVYRTRAEYDRFKSKPQQGESDAEKRP